MFQDAPVIFLARKQLLLVSPERFERQVAKTFRRCQRFQYQFVADESLLCPHDAIFGFLVLQQHLFDILELSLEAHFGVCRALLHFFSKKQSGKKF